MSADVEWQLGYRLLPLLSASTKMNFLTCYSPANEWRNGN